MATIPFRPTTAARRTKSRLAEVPATSNLAGIDTFSICRNSRWSGYRSNAGAKNIAHLRRILQYRFAPYVLKQLENAKRVDLVWDVYLDDSLKKSLREKRGTGQRRKVMGSTRIPSDWKGSLRVDGNNILGDPGADSRNEGKSKRTGKYGTKKSNERREEPLGTMSYQTSSKRSPPFWLLIGARKTQVFWHQSEARTAATVWNWSCKTLSPGAVLAVHYFSSCHILRSV